MSIVHIRYDNAGLRIIDQHFEPRRRVARIASHDDRTGLQRPQYRGNRWRIMRHQDSDAIAGSNSAGDQAVCQTVCRFVQFALCRLPCIRAEGDPRWMGCCHSLEGGDQRLVEAGSYPHSITSVAAPAMSAGRPSIPAVVSSLNWRSRMNSSRKWSRKWMRSHARYQYNRCETRNKLIARAGCPNKMAPLSCNQFA